jgi:hypothetical protein
MTRSHSFSIDTQISPSNLTRRWRLQPRVLCTMPLIFVMNIFLPFTSRPRHHRCMTGCIEYLPSLNSCVLCPPLRDAHGPLPVMFQNLLSTTKFDPRRFSESVCLGVQTHLEQANHAAAEAQKDTGDVGRSGSRWWSSPTERKRSVHVIPLCSIVDLVS